MSVFFSCLIALIVSGNILLPFRPSVVLEGKTASAGALLTDAKVQRILLSHGIQTHVTDSGSREILTGGLATYDFVFLSGAPAAQLLARRLEASQGHNPVSWPFDSPLVLVSHRPYVETLVANGVARPRPGQGSEPLYYDIDMLRFLTLTRDRKSWKDIGIGAHGFETVNRVLANTSDVCMSNSAGTYLALAAFVLNDNGSPAEPAEARRVAEKVRPILTAQGMPQWDIMSKYLSKAGPREIPVGVVYEHEYLAYQMRRQAGYGRPDRSRVLLYPSPSALSWSAFIPLDRSDDLRSSAGLLGDLLKNDRELRRRAAELGYRSDSAEGGPDETLSSVLKGAHIPDPGESADYSKVELPPAEILEQMIVAVGGCSPVDITR
ncbi:hypothetical protein ACFYY8_22595 [Streptosporangium sp. NPDC001559]|uniref:hypothetical protein n=1 Tax=Streptosporangium sp. NPDC001559 TaxID=3366187 RepID=UPI0036E3409D